MVSILRSSSFGGGGREPLRCSFCGRRDADVDHLVRARGVYICDSCVAQALEAIAKASPGRKLLRIRPTPSPLADRDAAEVAVERAFETVFDPEGSIEERCRAIDRGDNLAPAMHELGGRYQPADVSVDSVTFITDAEAEVHFTVFVRQLGPSGLRQTGHAVLVGDEWKVSRETWCGLVRMAGVECPPPAD
ncbi:MAG: ClpX C4-type zinc finger protein [Acidimicrobiales bacterium]